MNNLSQSCKLNKLLHLTLFLSVFFYTAVKSKVSPLRLHSTGDVLQ